MPRRPATPTTLLGTALQQRRGTCDLRSLAAEIGVDNTTLARFERGTHRPTYDTAVKLAAWLGWTTDQVMTAASQPAPAPDAPSQAS